jgi:HlyD family secretion protein
MAKVRRGLYEQFVQVEGRTRVKKRYVVLSPVSGVLERVTRYAGEYVKKGQTLAAIKWDSLRQVTSPSDGQVLKILRESAGPIEMGAILMEIGDTRELEIEAEVLTREAAHVKEGNIVKIYDWGGADLKAQVRTVEPAARTKISALGVEEQRTRIIMDFSDPVPENMGDGFKVQCRIVTISRPESLVIQTGALFRYEDGWAVYRNRKGRAELALVKVELRGPDEAAIAAFQQEGGLKAGDEIILFPGEAIQAGARIVAID